jgi:hypothetical protein
MEYRSEGMDDLYVINAAKTEFRDGYNPADIDRILNIVDPDLVVSAPSAPFVIPRDTNGEWLKLFVVVWIKLIDWTLKELL